MAAWVLIEKAHLSDYLLGPQVEALSSAALGDGQADPFEAIRADRCEYIRKRLSGRARLSATALTVPPELKTCACALILEAMQGRLSPGLALNQDQRSMIERAYKDLELAGTRQLAISTPDDPEEAAVEAGASPAVSDDERIFTRSHQDGL